jgi:hypothetical protein
MGLGERGGGTVFGAGVGVLNEAGSWEGYAGVIHRTWLHRPTRDKEARTHGSRPFAGHGISGRGPGVIPRLRPTAEGCGEWRGGLSHGDHGAPRGVTWPAPQPWSGAVREGRSSKLGGNCGIAATGPATGASPLKRAMVPASAGGHEPADQRGTRGQRGVGSRAFPARRFCLSILCSAFLRGSHAYLGPAQVPRGSTRISRAGPAPIPRVFGPARSHAYLTKLPRRPAGPPRPTVPARFRRVPRVPARGT